MKKFKIEILLEENNGLKTLLAKKLDIWPMAVTQFFKRKNLRNKNYNKLKDYTNAFNSIKDTEYTIEELFSLVE